jgi:hypothetical protein
VHGQHYTGHVCGRGNGPCASPNYTFGVADHESLEQNGGYSPIHPYGGLQACNLATTYPRLSVELCYSKHISYR